MKKNHIHRLKRHKYSSGNKVFFCTLDCTFKVETALALGMKTLCNMCNREFIMSEYTLKLKLPHCENCSKRKITDSEGKTRFVRAGITTGVLTSVAEETTQSLADRLKASISTVLEDDI